jgi:hypothetical protein
MREITKDRFGSKFYRVDGYLHREDGPAVEDHSGALYWFRYNKLHREDGPAVEYPDGTKHWFYHGEKMECSSQKGFERLLNVKAFW